MAAVIDFYDALDEVFEGLWVLFLAAMLLIVVGMVRATIISSLQDSHIVRNDSCLNYLPGALVMSRTFQRMEEGHFENLRDMEESEEEDLRAQQERMDSYLENLTLTTTTTNNNARFRKRIYVVGSFVGSLVLFLHPLVSKTINWE